MSEEWGSPVKSDGPIQWRMKAAVIDGQNAHAFEGRYNGEIYRHIFKGSDAAERFHGFRCWAKEIEAELGA